MAHRTDADLIKNEHNTSRFFTENRELAWVILIGVLAWGVFGYLQMPKRKDPEFPILMAVALCPWPGVSADKVEEMVSRKLEQTIGGNTRVKRMESTSRSSLSAVFVTLEDNVKEPGKQWDDIQLKLNAMKDLPDGAGPVIFLKDFGETSALMLTVASPAAGQSEISWRAGNVQTAIEAARTKFPKSPPGARLAGVTCLPVSVDKDVPRRTYQLFMQYAEKRKAGRAMTLIEGPGFVGVDGDFGTDDAAVGALIQGFYTEQLRSSELHPDAWASAVIRDPKQTKAALTAVAGNKYSYRELDDYTELIQRTLLATPLVSRVTRTGVQKERVFLEYSQPRLASYGLQTNSLKQILSARNITFPGGLLEVNGKAVLIDPSGQFKNEKEIGSVILGTTSSGAPVYLRDVVSIVRGYDSPPQLVNTFDWKDPKEQWHHSPAITIAAEMRKGEQIAEFGHAVDKALADVRQRLPEDLVVARVSDQPLQVDENVALFMNSLYEAVALVVLIALIGFWEWRSALLMALSIPTTLALTFAFMHLLGLDVQQVSIASLIIALGLLVDDPVVAGDAIKRELTSGHSRLIAAWLGPTRLATAILFATITNIVAYLPMLLIQGAMGSFIYSLPVVLTCSLVASRIVSMTFVPMLGYYLLRPSKKREPTIHERRQRGFGRYYFKTVNFALVHRKAVLASSLVLLVGGGYFAKHLKNQFFPSDLSYLSYVDVWLPEDSTIARTEAAARQTEAVVHKVIDEFGKKHPEHGKPADVLQSLTTFVGGGAPRFWFSLSPELLQPNYAQIVIRLNNKHDTPEIIAPLQQALSAQISGARVDVRQLQNGGTVGPPIAIRIAGQDSATIRQLGEKVKAIFRSNPYTDRLRDDWGAETFSVKLQVDPDRANLAGVSNMDVAMSSAAGMSGIQMTTLRGGPTEVPVVARLRMQERAQLTDVQDLYVYPQNGTHKIPLTQVSSIGYQMETEKIKRRNQFRTMTVSCDPVPGRLPSELLDKARPELTKLAASLPSGYSLEIGGEDEEQVTGFKQLSVVLLASVILIFLALVFQFRSSVKPLIVFAAIPYGVVGALVLLVVMGLPFGFMAFLGVTSLIGVIVSHVIVLFDFIEEAREKGESLQDALLDAGILRLRPVLITVSATVFALFPLAAHGGPLWEPMCYAQIGGLTTATVVTLVLVPVLYSIFVLDLKIVKWESEPAADEAGGLEPHSNPA